LSLNIYVDYSISFALPHIFFGMVNKSIKYANRRLGVMIA